MNLVLRSTSDATLRTVVLRDKREATLSFSGTRTVTRHLFSETLALVMDRLDQRRTSLFDIQERLREALAALAEPGLTRTMSEAQIARDEERARELTDEIARLGRVKSKVLDVMATEEGDSVHLPKVQSAQSKLVIEYRSARRIAQADAPRLLSYWESMGRDARNTLIWWAPPEAVGESGKPLPLSPAHESLLTAWANRRAKAPPRDEIVAWRWLIISWNIVNQQQRVPLLRSLRFNYSRKEPQTPAPTVESVLPDKSGPLKEDLDKVWASFVTLARNWKVRVKVSGSVSDPLEWNIPEEQRTAYLSIFNGLEGMRSAIQSASKSAFDLLSMQVNTPDSSSEEGDEASPDMEYPDSVETRGVVYHRLSLSDVLRLPQEESFAGWRAGPYFYGNRSVKLPGNPLGPPDKVAEPAAPQAKGKGKGKAPDRNRVEPPMPEGGYGEGSSKTAPPPKPAPEGDPGQEVVLSRDFRPVGPTPKKKGDPLNTTNPLRVKGEPRTRALTEDQKTTLKRYFRVVDTPIEPEAWQKMTPKERSSARAARSIPRWAVAAVARNPRNMEEIIQGRLTKNNFSQRVSTPNQPKSRDQAAATAAWLAVKGRFKGVPLYSNPLRPREKGLFEAYKSLKDRYGDQPCFPTPRRRQQGKGRDGRGVNTSSGGPGLASGLGEIIQLAKAFGEISRALRGG
jgi:hypothetical protein